MKVTLFTTSDCAFCKQEKEYLASKNISFEEKNVQTNRGFLQEMLDISNNFAGTPVTKIEKDDGQSVVLKGFTQSEFDNVFASNVQQANSTMPVPPAPTDQPVQDQPVSNPQPDPVVPDPVVPNVPDPTPMPLDETPPVEIPPFESPTTPPATETPSNPDPLPAQDDSTTEMHSTIPINPTSTNDPVTPPPTTDQPTTPPVDPVLPEAPMPEMPPIETPSTVDTPPVQEQPTVNQDQQLNAILDSLKTKAEETTTPATPAA